MRAVTVCGFLQHKQELVCRYTLMPRGDFITRNSFYEALCAGSIPVVFDTDYFKHCTYNEIIDYSKFALLLPEADYIHNDSVDVIHWLRQSHNDTAAAVHLFKLGQVLYSPQTLTIKHGK